MFNILVSYLALHYKLFTYEAIYVGTPLVFCELNFKMLDNVILVYGFNTFLKILDFFYNYIVKEFILDSKVI